MQQAKFGDTVKINFLGRLEDGTVFSNQNEKETKQFVIGENSEIKGLEEAVIGMSVGQSKKVKVTEDKAFGSHLKKSVKVVRRRQCPEDIKLGQRLKMTDENVRTTVVKVINISESNVTLDTNHPLAGKNLILDVKLVEIL